MWSGWRTDLGHAIKALFAHPRVAVFSSLCLSLGIGLNATIFTAVNGLLLDPLPLEGVHRLVTVSEIQLSRPQDTSRVSHANFLDWHREAGAVLDLAALRSSVVTTGTDDRSGREAAALVSWNFFRVVGIQPILGREFRRDEVFVGASTVVMISATLWQQQFDGNPGVIGRSVVVNGSARTVVGVVPRLAHPALPGSWRNAVYWMPLSPVENNRRRDDRTLTVYGALNNGVGLDEATARLATLVATLAAQHPANDGWGVRLRPFTGSVSPRVRSMLFLTMGAVGFVRDITGSCGSAA